MQTLASDILMMERGLSKTVTGKEHLERNDFIIETQKEEMKRLDATRQYREQQLEKANRKMHEVESVTNTLSEIALQKERQSEDLDKAISEKRSRLNKEKGNELLNAAVVWATGKSKALKGEIEDLRHEITTHEETIEQLQCKIQTMQSDHHRELLKLEAKHLFELNRKEAAHMEETTRLKNRISWQDRIIGCLSFPLIKTSDIFRKAVHNVIRLARDYYKPRFDADRCQTSKALLTCSVTTSNHIVLQGIPCTLPPSKKGIWIAGSKSKPDGKSITWWREIMTNSKKGTFDEKINHIL